MEKPELAGVHDVANQDVGQVEGARRTAQLVVPLHLQVQMWLRRPPRAAAGGDLLPGRHPFADANLDAAALEMGEQHMQAADTQQDEVSPVVGDVDFTWQRVGEIVA